jgi:peroxiredoxin
MRIIFGMFLTLGLIAGTTLAAAEKEEYPKAEPFTLKDVKGNEVTLDSLLATGPVYLETWDLPCVNCIAELDALMPVYDTLKERGLKVVALSVDPPACEARVKAFVKSKKWQYTCLLDQNKDVYNAYGVVFKPTAFLINMKGEVVYTHFAYKKGDEKRIRAEMEKWLPEEPAEEPVKEEE